MNYYLHDGQSISPPRTETDLREALRAGRLKPDTLCTQQGWTEWKPVHQVFPDAPIGTPAPPPAPPAPPPIHSLAAPPPVQAADEPTLSTTVATSRPHPKRRWIMETIKLLFVSGCGLCTSLFLGTILAAVEIGTGWALYSFTLWFVLPAGAAATGLIAAGGMFYAARWVHYYPRFLFFVASIAIATGTLAAIHFIVWSGTVVEGTPLREIIGFADYLNWVSHHTSIVTKHNATKPVDLGETVSFVYFAIQTLGFMFGGLCLFGLLRDQPYCHESGTYKKKSGVMELYERNPQTLETQVKIIKSLLEQGRHSEAIARHPFRQCLAKRGHSEGARSVITFYKSKKSPTTTLRYQVFVCTGKDEWKQLDEFTGDYETAAV
ncbi:MAG: DUF4339 domain-containing protein [Opitutaceae bacterium]|nr:DUF4339 domain-containing protein [Opitutaceae bacterium]